MSGWVPAGAVGQRAVGTSPTGYVPDKSVQLVLTWCFLVLLRGSHSAIVAANRLENLNFTISSRLQNIAFKLFILNYTYLNYFIIVFWRYEKVD